MHCIRSADTVTLFRTGLALLAVYLTLIRFNAAVIIAFIAIAMSLDAFDGYFAIREESKGAMGILSYLKALAGDPTAKRMVSKYRKKSSKGNFGPRIDVAGDRITEYSFWILFTYLNIVPLYVIFIILIRHSFADALMGSKGTSSHMKTNFARFMYSSNIARGGINVVKFLTFSYLVLAYVSAYPIWIGYVLTAALVAYILLRGIAEILEAVR